MLKNIINVTLLSLPLFCMTNCKDDEYVPGPTVANDNMGVYFAQDNEHEIIKGELDDKNIQVKLMREIATEAASVPIQVISQSGNLEIPATAEFKAGEVETSITITYKELVPPLQCKLAIPLEYANPYKIKEGNMNYSVSIHRLVMVSDNVRYQSKSTSDLDIFSKATSTIYQMEGENQFVWYNFMGSDINLRFKIDGTFDKGNVRNCYGSVIPLNHYCHDGEWGWYLTEEEDGNRDDSTFKTWTPEGSENGGVNEYMFFYDPYEGYSYFYIDFRNEGGYGYGTIESSTIDASDNYNSYYFYINY